MNIDPNQPTQIVEKTYPENEQSPNSSPRSTSIGEVEHLNTKDKGPAGVPKYTAKSIEDMIEIHFSRFCKGEISFTKDDGIENKCHHCEQRIEVCDCPDREEFLKGILNIHLNDDNTYVD